MEVGQVGFKDPRKVKRVLVPQRENPIVNRLNKTKVEKKPDLKQERDDRLKELRRRDQADFQARVSLGEGNVESWGLTMCCRRKKRPGRLRSGRRRSGRRIMLMMTSLPRRI